MYGGPEWETVGAFGSNLGNSDLSTIAVANALCNAYGLDTISTGMSIALTMECFERGVIDTSKTDGLEVRFGDSHAILELVEKIAHREGIGDVLASGIQQTLKFFGPAAQEFALHVKGQYLPMHEPRLKFGVGFGYAVAPGGADHLQIPHDPAFTQEGLPLQKIAAFGILEPMESQKLGADKVRYFTYLQRWTSLLNMLDICFFTAAPPSTYDSKDIVDLVAAVTGWDVSLWELMKAGERGLTMARLFNTRHGLTAADDTLPDRFFTPMPEGPIKGAKMNREEFENAKALYYQMLGWDRETGEPSSACLAELGLQWAEELKESR
jgi:aldehyde:ferredoxin oxidoreductase